LDGIGDDQLWFVARVFWREDICKIPSIMFVDHHTPVAIFEINFGE